MGTILIDELRGLSLVQPRIAMQLMKVMGQQSVNTYLKFKSAMLLKQPKMLEQLIPVFGFDYLSATELRWEEDSEAVRDGAKVRFW